MKVIGGGAKSAPTIKVFSLCCTLWHEWHQAVRFLFDGPAKASCISRVCCRAYWVQKPTETHSDHRILVGEDGCRGLGWGLVCLFFMDLSPTAAGDRVAVIVKKHCGRMCPLKWCSPGYKRRAPSQAARRLSFAPCWIRREPACYPGRPGTGQGGAAHCSQPQTPPEKTNHSSSVTTGIYKSCFIINVWTIPILVAAF